MWLCKLSLHDWQYVTRIAVYRKDDNIVNIKDEVFKRVCARCGRIERNVGKFETWVRTIEDKEK